MSDASNPPVGRRWAGGALRALLAHLPAALLALLLWRFLPALVEPPYPAWAFWAAEGVLAALFAVLLRCAPWWWGINALFPPLLMLALGLDVSPGWMGLLFLALLLVYWNAHGERVPLYLSNTATHAALRAILAREAGEARRVADLGSGLGGALRAMAEAPRVAEAVGFETAPLPWLISRMRFGAPAHPAEADELLERAPDRFRRGVCLSLARAHAPAVGQAGARGAPAHAADFQQLRRARCRAR